MSIKAKVLIWWIAPVLSVANLAAAGSDLRLAEAAKSRDADAVRSLLKQHADVDTPLGKDGPTALGWAAHWNDLETADLLIHAGANVNAANSYGVTPLWEACNNGSGPMVEKLAAAGANPNATLPGTGETALMRCASAGDAQAVKVLLEHGADVKAKELRKDQTALMWALEERHPEAARLLIEYGSDVRAKSKGGFTPLLFAARQGDIESARILLDKGSDVNETAAAQKGGAKGAYGEGSGPAGGLSALLVAADSGREDFAVFLVEKGANPNAVDSDGLTALHYSLRQGISLPEVRPPREFLLRLLFLPLPSHDVKIGGGFAGPRRQPERSNLQRQQARGHAARFRPAHVGTRGRDPVFAGSRGWRCQHDARPARERR